MAAIIQNCSCTMGVIAVTMKDLQNIMLEIRDFRREVGDSISKISDKLDIQSARITSTEKDIEYLSEKLNEKDGHVHKDIDTCIEALQKFKKEEVCELVVRTVKEESLNIKFWVAINFVGVVCFLLWSLRDFISAILTK